MFEKLYINGHTITGEILHEPFRTLTAANRQHRDHTNMGGRARAASEPAAPGSNANLLAGLQTARGFE